MPSGRIEGSRPRDCTVRFILDGEGESSVRRCEALYGDVFWREWGAATRICAEATPLGGGSGKDVPQ